MELAPIDDITPGSHGCGAAIGSEGSGISGFRTRRWVQHAYTPDRRRTDRVFQSVGLAGLLSFSHSENREFGEPATLTGAVCVYGTVIGEQHPLPGQIFFFVGVRFELAAHLSVESLQQHHRYSLVGHLNMNRIASGE
jgi:hypothetical protein